MEHPRKDLNTERDNEEKYEKIERSSNNHLRMTKRSQNTTASSTQIKTSTSRALCSNISSRTQSEPVISNTSNTYQTLDDFPVPTRASHTDIDLLGLAPQAYQGFQHDNAHQAFFIKPIGAKPPSECLYHLPILLMSNNGDTCGKNLDPMARWLAENRTEQCTLLHLPDGQLSIHKECQCSDTLQVGIEVEIEEQVDLSTSYYVNEGL